MNETNKPEARRDRDLVPIGGSEKTDSVGSRIIAGLEPDESDDLDSVPVRVTMAMRLDALRKDQEATREV